MSAYDAVTAWSAAAAGLDDQRRSILVITIVLFTLAAVLVLLVARHVRADLLSHDRPERRTPMTAILAAGTLVAVALVPVCTGLTGTVQRTAAGHLQAAAAAAAPAELARHYAISGARPLADDSCGQTSCRVADWNAAALQGLDAARAGGDGPAVRVAATTGRSYVYRTRFDRARNLILTPDAPGQPDPRSLLRPAAAAPPGSD